jgi:hypothetical protein
MASATMNGLATIEPYQPISGVPLRQQMASIHDHYGGRLTKLAQKHNVLMQVADGLRNKLEAKAAAESTRTATVLQTAAKVGVQVGVTGATAAMIGVLDGRLGGEQGYCSKWGVPADLAVAFAGCTGAALSYVTLDKPLLTTALGAFGLAGVGATVHRYLKDAGVAWKNHADANEAAAKPTAGAAPNGAGKGGVTYTVQHK